MRHVIQRYARALVLAGGLALGGTVAALAGAGVNPAATLASAANTVSTAVRANPSATSTPSTTTPSTCPNMGARTTTTGTTLSF